MIEAGTVTVAPYYHILTSAPRHVWVGASVSIPIFQRTRLRLDPGYQRIGITTNAIIESDIGLNLIKLGTTADRWRAPILLEAEVARHVRLGIGPEVSIVTGGRSTYDQRHPLFDTNRTYPYPPDARTLLGIDAALEFPFLLGPVLMAPEIRYCRWTGKHHGGIWGMDEVTAGFAIRLRPGGL